VSDLEARSDQRQTPVAGSRLLLVRSLLCSVCLDGCGATLQRGWTRLFGTEDWYVFVRHLVPPSQPVKLPIDTNGISVRHMSAGDIDQVARLLPFDLDRRPLRERRQRLRARLADAIVATRANRIVGAAWYMNTVNAQQPWYRAVEPHLIHPARFTANIFAVAGEKGAAWAIAKLANDQLAAAGVRSVVGLIRSTNKPSMLVSRLLGGKIVARQRVRYRFGFRTIVVDPVTDEQAFAK